MITEPLCYNKNWVSLVKVLAESDYDESNEDQFDGFSFNKSQFDKKDDLVFKISSEFKIEEGVLLSQILEINQDIDFIIPKEIHENLDELFFCFLNGKSKAVISIVGLLCERFCVCLFEEKNPSQISCPKQQKERVDAFSDLRQFERIRYLYAIGFIDTSTAEMLNQIRIKRNNTIHPSFDQNHKKDSIDCINLMISIFNKHKFNFTNNGEPNEYTN